MVLLRVATALPAELSARPRDDLSGSSHSSVSLRLSAANEASHRCMLEMSSVQATRMQAELYDEDEKLLCSSGPVSMADDDWVCLKTTTTSDGNLYKLQSCVRDCSDGWTLCFDVKERPDGSALLTHVRVARCVRGAAQAESPEAPGSELRRDAETPSAVDCTDLEESLHPIHRRLLHLFHQPSPELLNPEFWHALAAGRLSLNSARPFARVPWDAHALVSRTKPELLEFGHGRLSVETFAALPVCLSDLADAMGELQTQGFPPAFIFMYDEPWLLFLRLFGAMQILLESADVEMSLSVFAWALQDVSSKQVGSNFGRAHRDKSYAHSHFSDGRLGMVTTWVPVVPVTRSNGCMHVVPANKDVLATKSEDPFHLRPDDASCALGEALPCCAGETLVWKANTIHWGEACHDGPPRKSMATAFVVPGVHAAQAMETMTEESLAAGLSVETRLRIVLKSLLQYRSWYPDFAGVSLS